MGTHTASSHNQKKDNKYKNKKQPELPENQTVSKSNNQGVKEETFIQTDRRGGNAQPGRRGLVAKWWLEHQGVWLLVKPVAPQLCADKPGGTTGK